MIFATVIQSFWCTYVFHAQITLNISTIIINQKFATLFPIAWHFLNTFQKYSKKELLKASLTKRRKWAPSFNLYFWAVESFPAVNKVSCCLASRSKFFFKSFAHKSPSRQGYFLQKIWKSMCASVQSAQVKWGYNICYEIFRQCGLL